MLPYDDRPVLEAIEPLALAAGRRIMEIRDRGFKAETKADQSPVTEADRDAEAIILDGLRSRFPGVPIVAEEEAAAGVAPVDPGDTFFIVDALDGTREFVRGGTDFTVNIALVKKTIPVCGVVYAPARGVLYAGCRGASDAIDVDLGHDPVSRRSIAACSAVSPLRVVASRSHRTAETDAYIARLGKVELLSVGSSLKFCLLAAGEADLYPRLGRTMQWDTAAGDAVLRAAGGTTRTLDGEALRYGSNAYSGDAAFANPHFVSEGISVPR